MGDTAAGHSWPSIGGQYYTPTLRSAFWHWEELEETTKALTAAGIDVPAGGAAAVAGQPAERDYNTPDEVTMRIRAINNEFKSAIQQRDAKAKGMQLNEDQEAKIAAFRKWSKSLRRWRRSSSRCSRLRHSTNHSTVAVGIGAG